MEWYIKVLKQYADFEGRARRKEYWMFVLINFVIVMTLYALLFGGIFSDAPEIFITSIVVLCVYGLGTFIPSLAVAVRRLHDIGKSGTMLLIYFVPVIGPFWLIVLLATDSVPGTNKYGPNPKELGVEDDSDHLVGFN
jgi:uncharacterized membrane protein YhaH (DUF805 family)